MTKALRMSTMFLRTLREDPADADVVSDKLLQRACYLRKAAPGIWTWLPLGLNVLNKIENIIREEMASIDAQEVHFPVCCRVSRMRPPIVGKSMATTSSV